MSRNTKIILGIIAGLVVVCICAVAGVAVTGLLAVNRVAQSVEENMSDDPAQVNTSAASIAGFDLPGGYEPSFTMDLLGMKMVGFERNNNSVIMLMQVPSYMQANQEQLQQQMEQAFQQQFNTGGSQVQVVDQIQTEIKGQPVTLTISEMTAENGETARQLMTMFNGDNGMVMLMMVSPAADWDQDEVDAFIASIR